MKLPEFPCVTLPARLVDALKAMRLGQSDALSFDITEIVPGLHFVRDSTGMAITVDSNRSVVFGWKYNTSLEEFVGDHQDLHTLNVMHPTKAVEPELAKPNTPSPELETADADDNNPFSDDRDPLPWSV